jgi:hypothetical protein
MKVGLFIPCYINAVYPEVGIASYKLLRHVGVDVDYPMDQTCCGQPMANAGFRDLSAGELDNGYKIRRAAIDLNIPLITNARLASAFIQAFCTLSVDDICIKSWQEYK